MKTEKKNDDFRLSRVQAQGWNAARTHSLSGDPALAEKLNPFPADPERARWLVGFRSALNLTAAK